MTTLLAEPSTPQTDSAPGESPAERYARECRATALRLATADFLVLTALAGVLLLLSHLVQFPSGGFALRSGLLFAATAPIAFAVFGLYSSKTLTVSPFDEGRALIAALVSLSFVWMMAGMLLRPGSFGRPEAAALAAWLPLAFGFSLITRWAVRSAARRRRPERILVVGAGHTGQLLARRILAMSKSGVELAGFVDDHPLPLDADVAHVPVLPERDGFDAAARQTGASRLVMAFSQSSNQEILEAIRTSDFGRLPVSIIPRFYEITPPHSTLSEVNGIPVVDLKSARLSRGARLVKRAMDLAVSVSALVLLAPLLATVAAAIVIDSRGPGVLPSGAARLARASPSGSGSSGRCTGTRRPSASRSRTSTRWRARGPCSRSRTTRG